MARINVGDSKYDSEGGGGLPSDGVHLAYVSDAKCKVSQNGNDMIELEWTIHGPKDPDKGRRVKFDRYTITDAAMWRFIAMARAIDPTMDIDPADQDDVDRLIYGKPAAIVTQQYEDTYSGVTRTKVDVKEWRALQPTEERMLKKAYGPGLVPGSGMSTATPASSAPITDDDIPF